MTIPWLHNCAHSDDAWCLSCVAQLGNEAADLRSRVAELEAHRTELDCRYAGKWADSSGSHCPIDGPCMRCRLERAEEELTLANEHEAQAVANVARLSSELAKARENEARLAHLVNEDCHAGSCRVYLASDELPIRDMYDEDIIRAIDEDAARSAGGEG